MKSRFFDAVALAAFDASFVDLDDHHDLQASGGSGQSEFRVPGNCPRNLYYVTTLTTGTHTWTEVSRAALTSRRDLGGDTPG